MQHWSRLDIKEGEPCPVERSEHAAVCLGYGGDHPQLLVIGGRGVGSKVLSDVWILDIQSRRWREVRLYSMFSTLHKTITFVTPHLQQTLNGGVHLSISHEPLHLVNRETYTTQIQPLNVHTSETL